MIGEGAFQQPTTEQIASFVEGDPIAEDDVLRIVLPQLYRWAIKHHSTLPADEVQSLLNQVAAETCRPVVRYDPAKSKLTTYLINLFNLRVNDLYGTEARVNRQAELGDESRENLPRSMYNRANTSDATRITREHFFQEAIRTLNAVERDFLELIRQGEKSEEVYTEVLARHSLVVGTGHEVKNLKVRLQRRLRTLACDMGYELRDVVDD